MYALRALVRAPVISIAGDEESITIDCTNE
ncbi:hypothetical protein BIW11_04735 [Tropilaelaps mercedesae]|uniref:Uncharacterized protein n=1 Tax=Tropilaelaps mercedesae TaxID=418985 RepID=A0A1V9X2I8_9ACAR|nr:hypothetical protein BIW11_04735 [Tropilaelaps mercedesae]